MHHKQINSPQIECPINCFRPQLNFPLSFRRRSERTHCSRSLLLSEFGGCCMTYYMPPDIVGVLSLMLYKERQQ